MDATTYTWRDSVPYVSQETEGERFARLMDEKDVGTRELARRAKVSHGTIQNFQRRGLGESSHETVRKIARGLGMAPEAFRRTLMGFDPVSADAVAKAARFEVHPNWLRFPVYGSVSAGDMTAEPIEDDVAFIPKEHLTRRGSDPDNIRVYRVNGQCMISPEAMRIERSYAPGDYVAVDIDKFPSPGDIVVAWWDEEHTMVIKRYGLEEAGITLTPLGPGRPSIHLEADQDVHVLGPVVWRGG